jgi:hypothetical protein
VTSIVLKAINKCRRIYHLKRHGREAILLRKAGAPLPYKEQPRVTAVLQLFNKRENLDAILTSLLAAPVEEIIVLDDADDIDCGRIAALVAEAHNSAKAGTFV